jgi:hypothetical protein
MPHSGKRPGFAFERVTEHFIACKIRSLQRHSASEPLVDRKINLTHAPFSNEVDNEVTVLDQSVLGKRFHLSNWVTIRTEGNLFYIFQYIALNINREKEKSPWKVNSASNPPPVAPDAASICRETSRVEYMPSPSLSSRRNSKPVP